MDYTPCRKPLYTQWLNIGELGIAVRSGTRALGQCPAEFSPAFIVLSLIHFLGREVGVLPFETGVPPRSESVESALYDLEHHILNNNDLDVAMQ